MLDAGRLATLALRTLPRDCLIALAFHRVGDELPLWNAGTTPRDLERILGAFSRAATPVSLAELGTTRGRRLLVTFDDGFEDGADIAAPILVRLGIPAAFFLSAGCVDEGVPPWPDRAYAALLRLPEDRLTRLAVRLAPGRDVSTALQAAHAAVHGLKLLDPPRREWVLAALPPTGGEEGRPMSWSQARALVSQGFDVGSHGLTHAVLTTLNDSELEHELRESRRVIETRLGSQVESIAYPDGRCDERVTAAAASAGFRLGLAGGGRLNCEPLDLLSLARLSGEDARIGATALRLRRRPRVDASFAEAADRYENERDLEYGFLTQARRVRDLLSHGHIDNGWGQSPDTATQGMSPNSPWTCLDAGCGAGSLVPYLLTAGATEIVGVDAEPGMIDAARRRFPAHQFLRADVRRLPFPARRFGAAVSLGVLEYVDDPVTALRELARVVDPGGTVIVSVPQRGSPNDLGFRLAERLGIGLRERSRPLTEGELLEAAGRAGLAVRRVESTNFFAFPFDVLFPGPSGRLARAIDSWGRSRAARRLGAQLILTATPAAVSPVAWLVPSVPTRTTFLDRELAELRRLGVTVEPVTPALGISALRTFLRRPFASLAMVVRLQLLKAPRDTERGRPGYLLLALKGMALAGLLQRQGVRVHATFADGVGTVAWCAARLARVPFTFTAHSPYSLWQGSKLLRRQAEAAEYVFCVCSDVEQRLGLLAPGSRREVARCLGPADAPPRRDGERAGLLVAVGAAVPHKGFATGIRAVASAAAAGADVTLEVFGDGPELERLRTLARDSALTERVSFRGLVPNEAVLDRLSDALALLAPCEVQADGDRDGLPVSILDAAACGVPSIATPVAGIPEFVLDGETGLLVPQHDPEALAAAIVRLASDPPFAARLGAAARERLALLHDPTRETGKLVSVWFPYGLPPGSSAPGH
jgi:glycosyltransferase involved in cell wall biosynthesis/ubiquinone/menaquinone biosynthesis C-methylase UbiE